MTTGLPPRIPPVPAAPTPDPRVQPIIGTDNTWNLKLPLYGASFPQAIARFFLNYVNFKGRASRAEFWWPTAFLVLLGYVLTRAYGNVVSAGSSEHTFNWTVIVILVWCAFILPFAGVSVRRLHDTGKPWVFFLVYFIPFAGPIVLAVLCSMKSNPAGATYDDNQPQR